MILDRLTTPRVCVNQQKCVVCRSAVHVAICTKSLPSAFDSIEIQFKSFLSFIIYLFTLAVPGQGKGDRVHLFLTQI